MKVDKDIEAGRASWSFKGNVPEAFVEHVRSSVPTTTRVISWSAT